MVTQVVLRVRETLNVDLPIRSLFEAPTIAQFSQLIAEQIAEGTSPNCLKLKQCRAMRISRSLFHSNECGSSNTLHEELLPFTSRLD